jgi:hypothetical protein
MGKLTRKHVKGMFANRAYSCIKNADRMADNAVKRAKEKMRRVKKSKGFVWGK